MSRQLQPQLPSGPPMKPSPWLKIFLILFAAILVALVVVIVLLVALFVRNPASVALGSPSPTQRSSAPGPTLFLAQPTPGVSNTSVAVVSLETLEAQTAQAAPAYQLPTQTRAAAGSSLPPPPPTAVPTPPATPTPVSCETLQFTDDFENGLKPEWNSIAGEHFIVNGELEAAQDLLILEIGERLCDYQLSFDFFDNLEVCGNDHLRVIFGGELSYALDDCGPTWNIYQGENWREAARAHHIMKASGHVQLSVRGNAYDSTLDGIHRLRMTYGLPLHGPLRIEMRSQMQMDNFSLSTR